MTTERQSLHARIMQYMVGLPEGHPATANELLRLGSRSTVQRALVRLIEQHDLVRIERGLYAHTTETRFGKSLSFHLIFPDGLAAVTGETIVSHGASAANAMGLCLQVPMCSVYLTTGRSRRLGIGKCTVELRHASAWWFTLAGKTSGTAIRALGWVGPEKPENMRETVAKLRERLPAAAIPEMLAVRSQLPAWLAEAIDELAAQNLMAERRRAARQVYRIEDAPPEIIEAILSAEYPSEEEFAAAGITDEPAP